MKKGMLYAGLFCAAASTAIIYPENDSARQKNFTHRANIHRRNIEAIIATSGQHDASLACDSSKSIAALASIDYIPQAQAAPSENGNGCILLQNQAEKQDARLHTQYAPEPADSLGCALRHFKPIREAMLEYHCTPNQAVRNESLERVRRDLCDELRAINDLDSKLSTILHLQQLVCDELSRSTDIRAKFYLQSIRGNLSDEGAAIETGPLRPSNCYQYLTIIKSLPNEAKQHWYNLWIGIKQRAIEHEMQVWQGKAQDSRAPIEQIRQLKMGENY